MKTAGALLLILGAGLLGLLAAYRLRLRARMLRELERSMELLRCCLERFCPSTPELAHELSICADGAGASLFLRLEQELQSSDERDIAARWEAACRPLDAACGRAMRPFGAVLGRFGAAEQTQAAARTRDELSRLALAAEARSERTGRLLAAAGFSVGTMLALVLI